MYLVVFRLVMTRLPCESLQINTIFFWLLLVTDAVLLAETAVQPNYLSINVPFDLKGPNFHFYLTHQECFRLAPSLTVKHERKTTRGAIIFFQV